MRCALLVLACTACEAPVPQVELDAGADAAPSCDPHTLALHVMSLELPSGGSAPAKLYIEVVRQGKRGLFLVDTGSATTFLRQPLGTMATTNAGMVRIGCEDLPVAGYPETDLGSFDGLAVIGTIGVDRLLAGPAMFDVEHARLVLHPAGEPFAEAASWPSAPFDLVDSTVLAHVRVEGHDVRLLVDTGAMHTLVLGEQGQPGDIAMTTVDSAGNMFTVYFGSGELVIGGVSRIVPLERAPSFPYLESYITSLGGNIAGLLGLTSFARALVIDPSGTIRVEP